MQAPLLISRQLQLFGFPGFFFLFAQQRLNSLVLPLHLTALALFWWNIYCHLKPFFDWHLLVYWTSQPVLYGCLQTPVSDLVVLLGRFCVSVMNYWDDTCIKCVLRINSFLACTTFPQLVQPFSLIWLYYLGFQTGNENFFCLPHDPFLTPKWQVAFLPS